MLAELDFSRKQDTDAFASALFNQIKRMGIPFPRTQQIDLFSIKNYYSNSDSLKVKETFPKLGDFINHVLLWSYGLQYDYHNGRHLFKEVGESRRFTKRVNLFNLIRFLDQHYVEKVERYRGLNLEAIIESSSGQHRLNAGFAECFWDNTFNEYRNYKGNNEETICLFNQGEYAVASYLHSAHPRMHYLHVNSPTLGNTLNTAILVEAEGGRHNDAREKYLLVEGVLGNFPAQFKERDLVYQFLWKNIKQFAQSQGFHHIFINTSHSNSQNEPHQFVEYVFNAEKIKEKQGLDGINEECELKDSKKRLVFRLSRPKKDIIIQDLDGDAWFTHYFTVPSFDCIPFTLHTKKGAAYNCEQYNDLFHLWYAQNYPDKDDINAFWSLNGYAQGFEVECAPEKKESNFPVRTVAFCSVGLLILSTVLTSIITNKSEFPESIDNCVEINTKAIPPTCTLITKYQLEKPLGMRLVKYKIKYGGSVIDSIITKEGGDVVKSRIFKPTHIISSKIEKTKEVISPLRY